MKEALLQARLAAAEGEIPVGAVVVRNDKVIATARNRREADQKATAHAELLAIEAACNTLGKWRLSDCELYVTLEPCPMCAGAILNARLGEVVFGAYDPKGGACGSVLNLFSYEFNHHPDCYGGILESECKTLLNEFFKSLRK